MTRFYGADTATRAGDTDATPCTVRVHDTYRPAGHACDELCLGAASAPSECTCVCAGAQHGSQRRTVGPVRPDVAARRGRDLERLIAVTADLDEEW